MNTATKSKEYLAGYDCGINGANETNCNFTLFSTPEKTKEWEQGKKEAAASLQPKEDSETILFNFCHFLGYKGYKINGYDDGQLIVVIKQFLNKEEDTAAGEDKPERSEYQLLLDIKSELKELDKLPFGEMVKRQSEMLKYYSITRKK